MSQKFGVRMTLPKLNPLSLPHLLGEDFSAERWFETEAERAAFLKSYQTPFIYYRRGDKATLNYELLERLER